jgi:hypothetical protein
VISGGRGCGKGIEGRVGDTSLQGRRWYRGRDGDTREGNHVVYKGEYRFFFFFFFGGGRESDIRLEEVALEGKLR